MPSGKKPSVSKVKTRSSTQGPPWQLQTAKARFSEVFRLARSRGPQIITRQGHEAVVVIPVEEFQHLITRRKRPEDIVDFFQNSPLAGLDLYLERAKDQERRVEL